VDEVADDVGPHGKEVNAGLGGGKENKIKERGEVEDKIIIYRGLYCKISSCLLCHVNLASGPSWSETLLEC
jgi:hypothetical protein